VNVLLYSQEPIAALGMIGELAKAGVVCVALSEMDVPQNLSSVYGLCLINCGPEVGFDFLSSINATGCQYALWGRNLSLEFCRQALGLGVRGIIEKTLPAYLQVQAVQQMLAGELWFDKHLTDSILVQTRVIRLTRREGQLVKLVTQGLQNRAIGTALDITEGTVKAYLSRMFHKIGVKSRHDLAVWGMRNMGDPGTLNTTAGPQFIAVERAA
jgi:DNA-binding NarL/FixJ family response regulator